MANVSANTAYLAATAPACYTPAGAAAAQLQFQTWAANCRQAAATVARAETALLPVRSFPVEGATMEGPGADRLRQAVQDGVAKAGALGAGLDAIQTQMYQIADLYDLKAQQVGAQITEMKAHRPATPQAEALP